MQQRVAHLSTENSTSRIPLNQQRNHCITAPITEPQTNATDKMKIVNSINCANGMQKRTYHFEKETVN